MDIAELIAYYRELVQDLDSTAYNQTDAEVAAQLETSRRYLAARVLTGADTFTISSTPTLAVSAEPSDELGFCIATHAAWRFLKNEYQFKLNSGQFGVSWRSGLEQESSIDAAKSYSAGLGALEQQFNDWVLMINRNIFAIRIQ